MTTTLSKSVLGKYKNNVFVETGTLWGEAVEVAIECGFKKIYSMEIDPEKAKFNKNKFKKEIKKGIVEIIEGDSFKVFKDVISKIDSSATFWLDAHWDGDVQGEYLCPLPFELEALLSHPIKEHTLLIDDRRLFGVEDTTWGYTIDEDGIMESISDINKNYKISYEHGCVPNDIIVARV